MYLREISDINYKSSNFPILFENTQTDRVFGIISNDIHSFKFGWQSTIVKPVMKEISKEIYAIEIDQNFVIIDLKSNDIQLKLNLFYILCDITVYDNFIFVMTELEILIINKIHFALVTKLALPEFYATIEMNGQDVKFICVDGSEFDFNLSEI